MSKSSSGTPPMAGIEAEEFMAMLLWAQSATCSCPAALYFKRMGSRLVKQHVKVVEA